MELLRLQDRFAYLPEKEFVRLDMDRMERARFTKSKFQQVTGTQLEPASFLHTAVAENIFEPTVWHTGQWAFRYGGAAPPFYKTADGSFSQAKQWKLTDETGREVDKTQSLSQEKIYEIRVTIEDGADYDLDNSKGSVKLSVILGN